MLPSLILLFARVGSSRVSVKEAPPLLLLIGDLPPVTKLLTAAFLLYSSSTSRLFLFRINIKIPPAIAAATTTPTTTPATMPALFGPDDFFSANAEAELDAAAALDA